MCDMTHSHVWLDQFKCVHHHQFLGQYYGCVCEVTYSDGDMTDSYVWHDSSMCVIWLVHMCDMTHPHMCDLTRLIHIYVTRHESSTCVRHDSSTYVWHDSSTQVWQDACICVDMQSVIHTSHPHESFTCVWHDSSTHVWHDACMCVTWYQSSTRVSHICVTWLIHIPPKNGLIALWPSTNRAIPYFLVLLGSELSITEITEYTYFSPLKPSREFIYKSE